MGDIVVDALRTLLLAVALHRVHAMGRIAPGELRLAWQRLLFGVLLLVLGSLADTLSNLLPAGPAQPPLWVVEQVFGYGIGLLLVLWGGVRILADAVDLGAAAARERQVQAETARHAAESAAREAERRIADLQARLDAALAAQDRVEKEARANSVFLARMSHELRQPLTTVVGFAEVLKGEVFGPLGNSRYRDYVAGVLSSSRNLSARLGDLLDLCSIEAGELALHDEAVEPRDLVASCLQMFAQTALQRGCILDFEVDERLPPLRADSRRLKQILANLLEDSIERCGEAATIHVAVHPAIGGGISMVVTDPGVAVDPAAETAGALGRALARSLAELHQGRLAWRRGGGGGNEAELWLPQNRVLAQVAAR